MIIGYSLFGISAFSEHIPLSNSKYAEFSNLIADEIHIKNIADNNIVNKEDWTMGTVLLATLNGDLEAGNIQMRENPISKIRIKRRNIEKSNFITLQEMPFNPDPTEIIYDDYSVVSDTEYEYIVTPVDMAGIEGIVTAAFIKPRFEGWWLIDTDNPEENNCRFIYNMDDVSISTDEDRTEISTFAKYPIVRYGTRRNKKGQLSGLFIPEGLSTRKQVEKLNNMLSIHKPLLLKESNGRKYIVDVNAPNETVVSSVAGLTKVSVNWVEVGDYID